MTSIPSGPITDLDLPAIGSTVNHAIHGTGTVIAHANVHAEPEVTVDFAKAGVKRFLLRYAPLSQVEKSGYKLNALDAEAYDVEVKDELHKLKVRKAAQELLKAENTPVALQGQGCVAAEVPQQLHGVGVQHRGAVRGAADGRLAGRAERVLG